MAWTLPRTWVSGELVDDTIMNTHVRDNLLVIGEHAYTPKASDQNKASDTVVANDSALVMAVGTSQTWEWRARIFVAVGAGGLQYRWDVPASATGDYFVQSALGSAGAAIFKDEAQAYGSLKSQAGAIADGGHFFGILTTAGTSGNLSFAWAQNSSNVANTTIKAGSYIIARRIS